MPAGLAFYFAYGIRHSRLNADAAATGRNGR